MSISWLGKVAVITGGTTGMGFAMARNLLEAGMDVAVCSRSFQKVREAADALRETAVGRLVALQCDVSDRAQVYNLAAQIRAELGPADFVFANAGATSVGRYVDHQDTDWDWAIDVNLRGATNCVQAFYPDMVARRSGTILMTGSQTTVPPDWMGNHGPYVPAKAAVLALALNLRAEAAEYGVNVSVLIPSGVESGILTTLRKVPADSEPWFTFYDRTSLVPFHAEDAAAYISAQEAADRALAGLRSGDEIIATHGFFRPLIAQYCERLLAAYDKAIAYTPPQSAILKNKT